MLLRKAHVYRLYPTDEQAQTLGRWVGAVRFVYNLALEQRREWYRPGRRLDYVGQCREITELRSEVDWIRDVPVHSLQQAMRDLDRAYQRWWSGLTNTPTPRKRGVNDKIRFPDPDRFAFRRLSRRIGELKLPKIGWIRLRWDRAVPGDARNITVARRAGIWTASVQWEAEVSDPTPSDLPAVGIDRGVAVFAALSNGALIAPANHGKRALKALSRAQRKLARKKRGSNNRRKQARRIAKLHARVRLARKDFLHKASTMIAKNHGVVVLEKLAIENMTRSGSGTVETPGRNVRRKAQMNRAILDQGWGMFRTMLAYKLAERGGRLVEVKAAFTSQTCSECGVIDRASREGQRFTCSACGHIAHADTNAAINILRRADSPVLPVEGYRTKRPDEAGSIRSAA